MQKISLIERFPVMSIWLYAISLRLFVVLNYFQISKRYGEKPFDHNFEPWCKWDCLHFSNASHDLIADFAAFFPLWPSTIWLTSWLPYSAESRAIVLSNLLAVIVGVLLVKLGKKLWPEDKKMPWILSSVVLLFPYNHFWGAGYSETLYMAIYLSLLLALYKKNWSVTLALAGLLAVARVQGLWLAALLSLLRFIDYIKNGGKIIELVKDAILVVSPFIFFMTWQYIATGDALYFLAAQKDFERHIALWPWIKLHFFLTHDNRFQIRFDHILLFFSWFSFYYLRKKQDFIWQFLRFSVILLAELPLLFGGSAGPFFSYTRFMGINLAMFITLTEIMKNRLWAVTGILLLFSSRLFAELHKWYLNYFVG